MPIYAYRCESCGHQQDVLQKLSDPVLSECPACGKSTFAKQITAAGFQLKGSGWYQTDFRNGGAAPKKDGAVKEGAKEGASADTKADTSAAKSDAAGAAASSSTSVPAASSAPPSASAS